jgi:hypothetical protein
MRTRTALTVAGSAASLLLLGGVAYAAVQAVDDHPGPQVVIPSSSTDDRNHARHGADDPANHDANDDRNRGEARHGADDDPATHDVNDDRGGDDGVNDDSSNRGPGSDDSGSGHGGHGSDD